MKKILLFCIVGGFIFSCSSTATLSGKRIALDGFSLWQTGHDPGTVQLVPASGNDPLVLEDGKPVVRVSFDVVQYGEVSFPINAQTPEGAEAWKADISGGSFIRITYTANHPFILQLRQTGVHGGTHNHITLPASVNDTTVTIPYTDFKGGISPLNLTDVAKFNFAFLSNNPSSKSAELTIRHFRIDGYKP